MLGGHEDALAVEEEPGVTAPRCREALALELGGLAVGGGSSPNVFDEAEDGPEMVCSAAEEGQGSVKAIGCSSLRGGGGELGTIKNINLWLQLVCTQLKLKQAI